MKKKNLVKGCIIFMLLCLAGCGKSSEVEPYGVAEADLVEESDVDTTEVAEASTTEATEEGVVTEASTESNETEAAKTEGAAAGEISDDLYSYQIIINGELYQIPMDFSDLAAKGWIYDGDENEELDAYTYVPFETFNNGDYDMQADIINFTDSPVSYSACTITGISIAKNYNSGNDMTFILPKGIQSGVSTLEDVKSAYGEPTSEYGDEETDLKIISYEVDYSQQEIKLTFYDGILGDVYMKNSEY